jgi:hypothetical protein
MSSHYPQQELCLCFYLYEVITEKSIFPYSSVGIQQVELFKKINKSAENEVQEKV